MSATGLVLVYSLNTWLPELMLRAGYNAKGSLSFLLVLNGGAVIGALIGSRVADRFGPKPVVAGCFLLGAIAITLLTVSLPLALLLLFVAIAGLGTSGTQTLIYGFVANYYRTNVRGAGVAWCAGFGRLGGVGGPVIGGLLIGAGLSTNAIFWVLAGLGVLGVLLTLLVPAAHRALRSTADRTHPGGRSGRRDRTLRRRHMYERMLVAIDASPDSPDNSLNRTVQFARMSGCAVHLLHVARGHIIPGDISAGAGLGVRVAADDVDVRERQVVQDAVDTLAAAGIEVHGELIEATEHEAADVILQRARGAGRGPDRARLPALPGVRSGRARDPGPPALLDPAGPPTRPGSVAGARPPQRSRAAATTVAL